MASSQSGRTVKDDQDFLARSIALEGFKADFGERKEGLRPDRVWAAFRELGTMLWLDTGDFDQVQPLWTSEFTHLTTNNTLVNQVAQKGGYDDLIRDWGERYRKSEPGISSAELVREIGFILNCRVALRLVEAFDAHVSVELHPSVANDVSASVALARRYYSVCPERFLIKIPLTAAGLLIVRQLSSEGIPVNFTLGFSARQNYLAAVIARPRFVNVFMGRLNAFVADNGLGDGKGVGEKATLATQLALWRLRDHSGSEVSHLIGASIRDAQQLIDLAGIDVFTIPPKVASALRQQLAHAPVSLRCCAERVFEVRLSPGLKAEDVGLTSLWDLSDRYVRTVTRLSEDEAALASPASLRQFMVSQGCPNLLREWSADETKLLAEDGKIPRFEHWKEALASGQVALDALMSASALGSFAHDQKELDDRISHIVGA